MIGGVHFGYISSATNYGYSATTQGITVLESGQQIYDNQWTAFSTHAELGTTLTLPQAYGFSAVSTGTAMVDPTATFLSYSTALSGLGSAYQGIVQGLTPSGFGAAGTTYKVILDKNKARVFAFATSLNTWVPVLWADRFGHYVTFQWARSASGLAAGVTAISSVTATNQRAKGVVLRWAEYASNASVQDILTIDYVGLSAPSLIMRGYPGAAQAQPAGYVDTFQNISSQTWIVPSLVGSVCRPTSVQVATPSAIPQPIWIGTSGPAKPIPNRGAGGDGTTPSAAIQSWTFAYDSNSAELTSVTDPKGLTSTFTYTNYAATRGVSRVDARDTLSNKNSMRWTRTFPAGTSPLTVKLEGWWNPDLMATPDRYHLLTFPTDTLNYGNGVYQTDALLDTSGKTWRNTSYAYNPTGAGLNAGLSGVQSVTVQQDGAPALTTAYGYPSASKLQVTQANVTATDASGKSYMVSSIVYTYGTRWDMLEGHQLTQTVTTRYAPNGVTALPSVTLKNVYDSPASGPALLQLQRSYLDAGATGQHGASYSYDSQGRFYIQQVYHVEGAQAQSPPLISSVGYDTTSGSLNSSTMQDQLGPGMPKLTQTRGGFDSFGRATTQTDAAGVTMSYTFDDRGRTRSAQRAGSPLVTYAYPDELTVQSTRNGLTTTLSYDGYGRVAKVQEPTWLSTSGVAAYTTRTPTYDVYGRRTSLREVNGAGTSRNQGWTYDSLDRMTSSSQVVGKATTAAYGIAGLNRKTTTTLGNGVSTVVLTDLFGQAVEVDYPNGSIIKATYDGAGHQVAMTTTDSKGNSQSRTWAYDPQGRLTSKKEPETNTQAFSSFNALNLPTSVTEAFGTSDARTQRLTYDGFGRTLSITNGTDNLTNSYTGPNLMQATRTAGGVSVYQTYVYGGPGGRLSSETTTQPNQVNTIGYSYDTLGRLSTLTYPNRRAIDYQYDALNRITSILNNGEPLVSNLTFDYWGNRWQTLFSSGSQDQWDADLTGTQLKTWTTGYVGGGPLSRSYGYDSATTLLTSANGWTLTNDPQTGKLTGADGYGIKTSHTYDAFDNNTSHTAVSNGSAVPPSFNNFVFNPLVNNQIPGLESNGALTGWNTNLRGEATQVGTATSSGVYLGLGWDGLGLVKSVTWNGGNQNFLYAPSGLRVSLIDFVTSANNRTYAYSTQGLLLSEYKNPTGSSPAWNRDVIYLGSEAIAEIDASGVHELHRDHLGSPSLITRGSGTRPRPLGGTSEATQVFGPYGELHSRTGTYTPLTGYTGHMQADASGLVYMRGRYYSPAWHAFVNSDQGLDPNSWNQRAYVGGRPFMGTDPSGMMMLAEGFLDWLTGLFGGGGGDGGYGKYEPWDDGGTGYMPGATVEVSALGVDGGYSQGSYYWGSDPYVSPLVRLDSQGGGAPQSPQPQKKDCVTRQQILDAAAKWAGTPYGHGQQVQGVCGDCSGTVQAIYGSVGIQIQLGAMPSGSSAQGIFNSPSLSQTTNPQPGDIAYWSKPYNHTMIFSGNDKAWGARRPGQVFGNWPLSWFGNGASPTYLTSPKICDE